MYKTDKIINFSGGRTSAYMTKRLISSCDNFLVTFLNTGKEMPETLDFVNECDKRWNLNVVWIEYRYGNNFEVVNYETASRDGRPFNEMIAYRKGHLPNALKRFCTHDLKMETNKRYLKSIGLKEWTWYNGIRYDEPRRWSKAKNLVGYIDVEMPLVKWKVTKEEVLNWWACQDFQLKVNEPYGNCDLCFFKSKKHLAIIAKEKPELFDWWISKEEVHEGDFWKQGITYKQIKEASQAQIGLWDDDPSFECFCNVD